MRFQVETRSAGRRTTVTTGYAERRGGDAGPQRGRAMSDARREAEKLFAPRSRAEPEMESAYEGPSFRF